MRCYQHYHVKECIYYGCAAVGDYASNFLVAPDEDRLTVEERPFFRRRASCV